MEQVFNRDYKSVKKNFQSTRSEAFNFLYRPLIRRVIILIFDAIFQYF